MRPALGKYLSCFL